MFYKLLLIATYCTFVLIIDYSIAIEVTYEQWGA